MSRIPHPGPAAGFLGCLGGWKKPKCFVCVFLVYLNITVIPHMPPDPRAGASVDDGGEL